MMRNEAVDDYEDDDNFDSYGDDEGDEPTIACPYCREEIHEDAQRCPRCERYISAEDAPAQPKPWWILVGVAVCLYAVFSWFF